MGNNFKGTTSGAKDLTPFRFWCQKVLPAVYDDSLSYYELLCKVVNKLNESIENVNILGDFVDNYFVNLDVQNEINNKLDSMVMDGTLNAFIQPIIDAFKADINESVKRQDEDIASLKGRVDTLTALPEGSTTGDAELQDIRVGYDGTVHENAGNAVRAIGNKVSTLGQFRFMTTDSTPYARLTSNLTEDGYYSLVADSWDDLPCGHCNMLVFQYSPNYVVQIATEQNTGAMFNRIVHRTEHSVFRNWVGQVKQGGGVLGNTTVRYTIPDDEGLISFNVGENTEGGAGIWLYGNNHPAMGFARIQVYDPDTETYRKFDVRRDGTIAWNGYVVPTTYHTVLDVNEHGGKLSNVTVPGYYVVNVGGWDDYPLADGCAFIVVQYSYNYCVQIAISTVSGLMVSRIVHRTNFSVYRDWQYPDGTKPVKVLCLGDSICYGVRNSNKGFVGDLGVVYKNIGVSGATLSNIVTTKTNIPNQLVGETDFKPDVIVANGGVNDFAKNAQLGVVPTKPVTNDAEANALNRSTVLGGLQYLLYKMVTLHPSAQRFFLLTHRTTATLNGVVCDWGVTENTAGYTQTELYDAFKSVCALYGVKIIDVYGQSMINTAFPVYVSKTAYSTDSSVTNSEFVDSDGIHPLAYGYLHGYVPLVREALGIGTRK